ncbi:MAG TPA: GGDEF domain-containing protein [Actinomycetota bacterium]|nr:GGDEF domain-containing protein [Actinomycetota bacterium]
MRGTQKAQHPEPFQRETLFRNVGPLVGAAFSGILSLAISQSTPESGPMLVQAATLTALTLSALVLVPWHKTPRTAMAGPAFAYLAVATLIRHSTGGVDSIYAQLVLVPILWLATYGSLLEVGAGVAGLGLAVVGPLLLMPGTSGQWPRTIVLVLIATAVGVGVQKLFAYLRAHAAQLDLLARTDPLTGVSNRRAWDEQLEEQLLAVKKLGQPLCVALIDVDHFKDYNDSKGHQAGDRLLKEVTAWWRNQLRDGDILARFGGDEFGIILPGCPLEAAHRILERLSEGMPPDATCSTGLVSWNGIESHGELVARADQALYGAKEAGRNRIVVA